MKELKVKVVDLQRLTLSERLDCRLHTGQGKVKYYHRGEVELYLITHNIESISAGKTYATDKGDLWVYEVGMVSGKVYYTEDCLDLGEIDEV